MASERPSDVQNRDVVVTAVMPCLNEERTIGICVTKALYAFRTMGIVGEVVVADNGSTDRSVEIAKESGARVVLQPLKGYGAAVWAGIAAANGKVVVMGDADDSYDWREISGIVQKVLKGDELVMGIAFSAASNLGLCHSYIDTSATRYSVSWGACFLRCRLGIFTVVSGGSLGQRF
jgi:glycosyltransferase involved in cell wall biosynthesis